MFCTELCAPFKAEAKFIPSNKILALRLHLWVSHQAIYQSILGLSHLYGGFQFSLHIFPYGGWSQVVCNWHLVEIGFIRVVRFKELLDDHLLPECQPKWLSPALFWMYPYIFSSKTYLCTLYAFSNRSPIMVLFGALWVNPNKIIKNTDSLPLTLTNHLFPGIPATEGILHMQFLEIPYLYITTQTNSKSGSLFPFN